LINRSAYVDTSAQIKKDPHHRVSAADEICVPFFSHLCTNDASRQSSFVHSWQKIFADFANPLRPLREKIGAFLRGNGTLMTRKMLIYTDFI